MNQSLLIKYTIVVQRLSTEICLYFHTQAVYNSKGEEGVWNRGNTMYICRKLKGY